MSTELTSNTFQEFISSEETVIVDFWAEWCGPCRMVSPELDKLSEKHGVAIGKLNVDENPDIAQKYGIMSIPAMYSFRSGEVTRKMVGAASADKLAESLL